MPCPRYATNRPSASIAGVRRVTREMLRLAQRMVADAWVGKPAPAIAPSAICAGIKLLRTVTSQCSRARSSILASAAGRCICEPRFAVGD
jgi:hypothetical protein